ncbi:MAG: hypothetical protein ACRDRS_18260 [Pseudonocardiaceae bacterium]
MTDVRAGRVDLDIADIHPRTCGSLASGDWLPSQMSVQAIAWSVGALVVLAVSFAFTIRCARRNRTGAARVILALALIGLPIVTTIVLVTATDASSYHDQFNGLVANCATPGR